MTFTRSVSWGRLCAIACLVLMCGASAQAAELPWYKRIFRRKPAPSEIAAPARIVPAQPAAPVQAPVESEPALKPIRSYKQEPSAFEVDDTLPEFLDEDEAGKGPDLSKERTPADEQTKREFPMPQARVPEAPRVPPSPDRYQTPAENK